MISLLASGVVIAAGGPDNRGTERVVERQETPIQTVSTLPVYFDGANSAAEIDVHPSGKWVYVSNRGHNSVVLFAVDPEKGTLTYVEEQGTGGRPDAGQARGGDEVAAAGQDNAAGHDPPVGSGLSGHHADGHAHQAVGRWLEDAGNEVGPGQQDRRQAGRNNRPRVGCRA